MAMDQRLCALPPTTSRPTEAGRRWANGWRRIVFPSTFLVYLVETASQVLSHNHLAGDVIGLAIQGLFCAVYVWTLAANWFLATNRRLWTGFAVLVACLVAELPFAHESAFVMAVFITTVAVARLRARAAPIVMLLTASAVLVPPLFPSWHESFSAAVDDGLVFSIPSVGIAMFAFFEILRGNEILAAARAEIGRLAAENERIRIARDLHDVLGHSLTTITVKAELARRLCRSDPAAAEAEVAELSEVAREALAEVRATVSGYRKPTLAGELAAGREMLKAAGITLTSPMSFDHLDDHCQEVFPWVVREGLTNVARHSGATSCRVDIAGSRLEITDNGKSCPPAAIGSGLAGLGERVKGAGGTLEVGPGPNGGWRLVVALEPTRAEELAGA
jgi:two-component system sensor histidine kinase DesK